MRPVEPEPQPAAWPRPGTLLLWAGLGVALYLTSRANYLLFHVLAEGVAIVVAVGVFLIVWNTRRFLENDYLLFLGTAYAFVAGIDAVHTLAYRGMAIIGGDEANTATQLWIAARYLQGLSLLLAPFYRRHRLRLEAVLAGYVAAMTLLLLAIFAWRVFPDCFLPGTGLTPFKTTSEYVISAMFLGAMALLFRQRERFDRKVLTCLLWSMLLTVASELAFTFYVNVYGFSNFVGHFFKMVAFFLISEALIETGLARPYALLFRQLKEREETLRASEERIRLLGDNLPESAVYQYAQESNGRVRFLYVSAGIERLNGVRPQDVLQNAGVLHRQILPEYRAPLVEAQARSARTLSDLTMEVPMRRPDGEVRWMRLHSRPRRLLDGGVVWDGVQIDVTARKQVEEALHQQARLLDLAHDAIVVWALGGAIEYWNAGAERLYGYTRDEALGRDIHTLLATFHPEALSTCLAHLERTGAWRGDLLHVTKDDRVVVVESQMVLVPRDGRRLVLETNRDITARQQAEAALRTREEQLRLFVEHAPAAIAMLDTDLRYVMASQRWLADYGLAGQDVRGRHHYDLFPEIPERWKAIHRRCLGGAVEQADEDPFVRTDGTTQWLRWEIRPWRVAPDRIGGLLVFSEDITARKQAEAAILALARFPSENPNPVLRLRDEGIILYANEAASPVLRTWGRTVGDMAPAPWPALIRDALAQPTREGPEVLCAERVYAFSLGVVAEAGYVNLYGTDITARKEAEAALQATLAELRRSNQDLEQFATVASHDLQEPLRMVTGFTQLLARRYQDRLDKDAHEFIALAVDGATRMQRLIQGLLAYSRVSTRGADLAPTDAGAAVQAALRNLQAACQESGAEVTAEPLPTVKADATQLTQLLQNLIGNALKFRGEAPPRVHVTATPQPGTWLFAVQDNGIGIAPEYFARIFGIFQRLHTTDRYPGTGIGLALCQRIVERHGGRIWVESTPGQGATFYFTLPRPEEGPA